MTLDEALKRMRTCSERMREVYQKPVFDEWAFISLLHQKERVLAYVGPRREDFHQHFERDVQMLRADLLEEQPGVGDFAFARDGKGTRFDAFLVVNRGLFLICNNTAASMNEITRNELWLAAQVPFVELSDRFRADPLVLAV